MVKSEIPMSKCIAYERMGTYVQSIWGNKFADYHAVLIWLWESTRSWNAGIDLNFFNNRVEFIVDAYIKRQETLLQQALSGLQWVQPAIRPSMGEYRLYGE